MAGHSDRPGDVAAVFAGASRSARGVTAAASGREAAIREVAARVAGPALAGFTVWMLRQARARNLAKLRFLSRDGQVLYELARRIAPRIGVGIDLEYVYSSRLTWSLAATDSAQLASADWLFNSFMKSNATDVCARPGLPARHYEAALAEAGVSMDPLRRADDARQLAAPRQFLRRDDVISAAAARIRQMRALVTEYAAQAPAGRPAHRAGGRRMDRPDGRIADQGLRGRRDGQPAPAADRARG